MLTFDQAYVGVLMTLASMKRWVSEDAGLDDSPSKLIWIAVSVALAIAAGAFAIKVFGDAKSGVPLPIAPKPT